MAIAFTACTNEELLQEGNSNGPSAEQVTITAYTPGDDSASSRVTQGDYEVGQTIPLTWDNDDQISVYFAEFTNTYTKSEEGENTFTGDEFADGEGSYFAFYPALAEDVQDGNVPFDLSNQTGSDAYLMYAVSDDRETYHFQHAAAYLKTTFPESLKNTTATITLTVPEGIYTKGSIDLEDFTLRPNNEYKNTIIKTVEFGASTEVWFAIPPMATGDKKLNFKIKTASNSYSATLAGSAEKAIEAGKYYSANITMQEGLTTCTLSSSANYYMKQAIGENTTINSIVFNANSTRSTSGAKQVSWNGSLAYAKVEGTTLYVYTTANEIKFYEESYGLFSGFNTVQTINFNNCINTSSVTSMSNMFNGCTSLESLDLSSFNTSNVTTMRQMFNDCTSLKSLDLSNFNTSNVETMEAMFNGCTSLKSLDLSSFNTSNVTTMFNMFSGCNNLAELNLSSFNTSNVTTMQAMFNGCKVLKSLNLSNFNTSNVKDMREMFMACIALETLDLSSFDTSNVTNMTNMFRACESLETLDLSNFNTSIVSNMYGMFMFCESLQSLDLCSFTFNCTANNGYKDMFDNCNNLTNVYVLNSNYQATLQGGNTDIKNTEYIKVCTEHGAS